jgi:O-antigen/teichoic acid export membrane protein
LKLLKNFLSLAGAELISKVVTFAAFAYLGRILGPDGFGYIEFAGAVILCAGLIVDQGFGSYGAREIAKAPERTTKLVSEIVIARFALAMVAYSAIAVFAFTLDRSPLITRLLLLYGLSVLAMPLFLQWVFQGHDRMSIVALIQVLRQTIFAAVVFIFVHNAEQVWMVAMAEVAGVFIAALYGLTVYCRQFGNPFSAGLKVSRQLIYQGVPIGLGQMFWVVKMFGATVILGLIASAEDIGLFAAAMRILIALHTFIWFYYFNLLPSLSREWQKGSKAFAILVHDSLRIVTWIGTLIFIIWVLVAPIVVTTTYGLDFSVAGSALQWLAVVFLLAAINGHYRFGLIAAGQQNIEMATAAFGAVAALILIPIGYAKIGVTGAAVGLAAVELLVWWATWWCSRRWIGLNDQAKVFIRPLAASIFMCGLLRLLPFSSPLFQSVIVLAVMPTLAFVLDEKVRELCRRFVGRPRTARLLSKEIPETTP